MNQVYWTEPLTVSELPVYPMGMAIRFEKNQYGLDGNGAAEKHRQFQVGDKVRCFMSFGHISDIVKA